MMILQGFNYWKAFPAHDPLCSSFLATSPWPMLRAPALRRICIAAAALHRQQPQLASAAAAAAQESKQWVHFIGIGGAGISVLAFFALNQGWKVSGSDISWSQKLEELQRAGATVYIGHRASQIRGDGELPNHVVLSSSIPYTNEEVITAQELNIPIHKRGPWLARLTSNYDLIAISGTHGKSTTTAMVSMALKHMGNDISALVGANVFQFPGGGGGIYGNGKQFVLEADEYDFCFLSLSPYVALITNIEWEHVDMFPNEEAVIDCFRKFAMGVRPGGTIIFCGDNAGAKSVANDIGRELATLKDGLDSIKKTTRLKQLISYGLGDGNIWQAAMLETNSAGGTTYVALCNGVMMTKVELKIPGVHNVLNSLAAIVTAAVLSNENASPNEAEQLTTQKEAAQAAGRALQTFAGVQRRFEQIGTCRGFQLFDDYAHHPTEILAVVGAVRMRFPGQPLWLIFQPHTYSRLVKLLDDFAVALSKADHVIVTQVYSARESNSWGITGKDLVNRIHVCPAVYIPQMNDICTYIQTKLSALVQDEVIIFTLGAGDIRTVGLKLMQSLNNEN